MHTTTTPQRLLEADRLTDRLVAIGIDGAVDRGGRILTVTVTAPAPDVVRLQVRRRGEGKRELPAPLEETTHVTTAESAEGFSLISGALMVRVLRDPWALVVRTEAGLLTQTLPEGLVHEEAGGGAETLSLAFSLGMDELLYGGSGLSTPLPRNGQTLALGAGEWGGGQPLFVSSRGYALLLASPACGTAAVGTPHPRELRLTVPAGELDCYVAYGPSPLEALRKVAAFRTCPALPAPWALGLWLTVASTPDWCETETNALLGTLFAQDLPLRVVAFDRHWMRAGHWSDFTWDARAVTDPAGMLRRLKAQGVKVCVWISPAMAERSTLFAEAVARGVLLQSRQGGVCRADEWQPGAGLLDLTAPAAVAWWQERLALLLEGGIDGFLLAECRPLPGDAMAADGSTSATLQARYPRLFAQAVNEVLVHQRGIGGAVALPARTPVLSQQAAGEDAGEPLAEAVREELAAGVVGEVFGNRPMAESPLFPRWAAFALLTGHSRLPGGTEWARDPEALAVVRHFTGLKHRLMPYLYSLARDAAREGVPLVRPMAWEFPEEFACRGLDRQFMLGPSLLVAPVLSADGQVEFFLPEGRWTEFFTGQTIVGGQWWRSLIDSMTVPLYVRENSLVPMGVQEDRPDYDYHGHLVLHLYQIGEGMGPTITIPRGISPDEAVFRCGRKGEYLSIMPTGALARWTAVLHGIHRWTALESCEVIDQRPEGLVIAPTGSRQPVTIGIGE
jgi:alpha-D-xyloside xylohydrolase